MRFLARALCLKHGAVALLHQSLKVGLNPSNYLGICISSCLGKLFCSILNQRLLEHVQSLDILHKSQIGFLANNRTADHVLTLRTLIDKYMRKYMHVLWTLGKHLIWSGMMDFFTSCYKLLSEEASIM